MEPFEAGKFWYETEEILIVMQTPDMFQIFVK
jgi:hypothetical protein